MNKDQEAKLRQKNAALNKWMNAEIGVERQLTVKRMRNRRPVVTRVATRTTPPDNGKTLVVVVIAEDGTPSVVGPFASEYLATLWGNQHENDETGWTCYVQELEPVDWRLDV